MKIIKAKIEVDNKGSKRVFKDTANDVDNLDKKFISLSGTAGKLSSALAGIVAADKVKDFMIQSAKLADIQILAENKLTQALGFRSKALIDQASALQQVTRYGDEATIEAQAMVAMFIKEEDQIARLTPLIQDLASAKGMDLVQAADLVAKSIGSDTNAMSRYGIQIEGTAGSVDRIDSAINALTKSFKGQAEVAGKSGVGAIKQLEMAYGDLQETIGFGILNDSGGFVGGLKDIVVSIDNITKSVLILKESIPNDGIVGRIYDSVVKAINPFSSLTDIIGIAGDKASEFNDANSETLDKIKGVNIEVKKNTELLKENNKVKQEAIEVTDQSWRDEVGPQSDDRDKREQDSLDREKEAEQDRQRMLEESREASDERHKESIRNARREREENDKKVRAEVEAERGKMDTLSTLSQMAHDENVAFRTAGKASSIAMMYINTEEAVTKALASLPPPANFAAAGLIGAAGAASIAKASGISAFAKGGDFVTNGPELIMVGDNQGGRERVQITPESSPNINGPSTQPQMTLIVNTNRSAGATKKAARDELDRFAKNYKDLKKMGMI